MTPFKKGALISALWWIPIGVALTLMLQFAAVVILGQWIGSGGAPEWLTGGALRDVQFRSVDTVRDLGKFDYEWTVRTLDGEEVPMEEFRGKVIFFNVWATWCLPCVMEMPSINRLYRSVDSEEIAFVIVTSEDPEVVRDFLDGKDWGLPIYLVEDEVPDSLANEIIPHTRIASPEGRICFIHEGSGNYDTDGAREFLNALAGRAGT